MATVLEGPAADIRQRMDADVPAAEVHLRPDPQILPARPRPADRRARRCSPGQSLLDIGCGTGRNLALIGQRYPAARLYGLDAAEPMLEIAARRLSGRGVRATLAHGVAEELDPQPCSARSGFDHVTISYCLSMVDDPEAAVRARPSGIWRRAARCTSSISATWRAARLVRRRDDGLARKFHVRLPAGGRGHAG